MFWKKIQFFVLVICVLAAGFSSWYVYRQSQEFKTVKQGQGKGKVYTEGILSKENETAQQPVSKENATAFYSINATQALQTNGTDAGQENATAGQKGQAPLVSAIQDVFLTSFVVNDLAGYLIDQYHPGGSSDNPKATGVLELSFKSLNGRYGLELVGVKHADLSLDKAREKVLSFLMNPEVLRQSYELAADDFVRALIREAEACEKVFIRDQGPAERSPLRPDQIKEALRLSSGYLQNLSRVFGAMAGAREPFFQVGRYLQADKQVDELSYAFQQERYKYEELKNKASKDDPRQQEELDRARVRKKNAARQYRLVIQHREGLKQDLIRGVRKKAGPLELNSHEILYIAKWVHRRRMLEQDHAPAIRVAADLLQDMSHRLARQAATYSSSKR